MTNRGYSIVSKQRVTEGQLASIRKLKDADLSDDGEGANSLVSTEVISHEEILNTRGIPLYYSQKYWNTRYASEGGKFESFFSWEKVESELGQFIPARSVVGHLGCGTSTLGTDLQNVSEVYNFDFSDEVISIMEKRFVTYGNQRWIQADVTSDNLGNSRFDVVIDKGTLDSIMTSPVASGSVETMMLLIYRSLKKGGVYILISRGKPQVRVHLFKGVGLKWNLEETKSFQHPIIQSQTIYAYILRK